MNIEPLNDDEIDFIDQILMKYENDASILNMSELDGFLTAIVSGPQAIMPSRWFPEVWGGEGNEPEWESQQEVEIFTSLLFQHMNNIIAVLMNAPEIYEALFKSDTVSDKEVVSVDDWCYGYLRGVDLGNWSDMSENMEVLFYVIELNGREEYSSLLKPITPEDSQKTAGDIEYVVRRLYQYWLDLRSDTQQPTRAADKIGRNDPCPCGSGKKYKQCCLH